MNKKKNNTKEQKIDFAIGGQALIEGVMMRSPNYITASVRTPNGEIHKIEEKFKSVGEKVKLFRLPLIRGVVNLIEMMVIGMKFLNFSAEKSIEDFDQEVKNDKTQKSSDQEKSTKTEKIIMGITFAFSIVVAFALSIFLFKFLPLLITNWLSGVFKILEDNWLIFNLVDGLLKTSFFILYIAIVGLLPSLRRVFEYHGAEHKSIFTYEKGLELTPKNASLQSRFHPRCGTSFIIIVFVISIFVYTFVPKQEYFLMNFVLRIVFLPLIAGISYEFLKWSAKKQNNFLMKLMITPGLWFQRLTTKEPDLKQLEVALESLKRALELEKELEITKRTNT